MREDLIFASTGDSRIVSYYYNPKRRVTDVLNRNACLATFSFMNDLIEVYPKSTCILSWTEGKKNSGDLVSKFFKNPITQANSIFFIENQPFTFAMKNKFLKKCSLNFQNKDVYIPKSYIIKVIATEIR